MSRLNKELCGIIDADKGYDNKGLADKIEQIAQSYADKQSEKFAEWMALNGVDFIRHPFAYIWRGKRYQPSEILQIFKQQNQ